MVPVAKNDGVLVVVSVNLGLGVDKERRSESINVLRLKKIASARCSDQTVVTE